MDISDATANAREVTLETVMDPNTTLIANSPFTWSIRVWWMDTTGPIDPQLKKAPDFENLSVSASSTTYRTVPEERGIRKEKIFSYKLVPRTDGTAAIGSAVVAFNMDDEETLLTTARNELQISPEPFSWGKFISHVWSSDIVRGLLILLLILLAVGVTVYLIKRRAKTEITTPEETRSPVQDALDSAKRFRLEGDAKGFARSMEQAVLLSLQQKHLEWSHHSLPEFRELLTPGMQPVLDRFVQNCENLKYAPTLSAQEDFERLQHDAERLMKE